MPTDTHALSRRVNELFHDCEGAAYDHVHPEIFLQEQKRWEEVCNQFIASAKHPLMCLDVGCGTGFVGMSLLPALPAGSTLMCADISAEMLNVCKQKLTPLAEGKTLQFLKMHTEKLDVPDASLDVVTMNSVLHHMPDDALLLQEIRRVLKPGGILCIGHEPNSLFFHHAFLRKQATVVHYLTWKRMAAQLLKWLGLYATVVQTTKRDHMNEQVNAILLQEHLVEKPLSGSDISKLIDIHSPTAGGLRMEEGFNPLTVLQKWNGPFHILYLQTYNHLLKMSNKGVFRTAYGQILSRIFPQSGATFFLVAQKTPVSASA